MPRAQFRLTYRPPFDWAAALGFLRARAIDGVEQVDDDVVYRRTIRCGNSHGTIEAHHDAERGGLLLDVRGLPSRVVDEAAARVRRMFDLDADLDGIAAHLARDPWMAPLVAAVPVRRVLRGWDGFEVAVRTIVGQQITVAGARRLNGILVERCGARISTAAPGGPHRLFPTPDELLAADLSRLGMPGARVAALQAVARAAIADPGLFEPGESIEDTVARLRAIRGIGEWTAHYIAMRACGEPDAFPASDVGLLRGAADADGRRPAPAELLARSKAWRPWRAYAAHQLWAVDSNRAAPNGSAGRAPAGRPIRAQARECAPGSPMRE